jgi:hypothetical protein
MRNSKLFGKSTKRKAACDSIMGANKDKKKALVPFAAGAGALYL